MTVVEQSLAMYVKQIVRIGNEEWFYFNRNHDCSSDNCNFSSYSDTFNVSPIQGQALYKLAFATLNDSTWVLTATPISTSSQAGDGIICLNDQGQKFWAKGATVCALSASSSWTE